MKKILLFAIFFTCLTSAFAQNCTVNANVDRSICVNQTLTLVGAKSGAFANSGATLWQQISGPSVTIVSPSSLTTNVVGYTAGNVYGFRLSTKCLDGYSIFDDVKITVLYVTTANAASDRASCPGLLTLAGNSPGVNETGSWSVIGTNNAGASISTPSSAGSSVTLAATSAGTTTLRWTITNTNTCTSTDDMGITNYGGVSPVDAGPSVVLSRCYSTTQSYKPTASFGGTSTAPGGQKGVWSLVSGPSIPTQSNTSSYNNNTISNLVAGVYLMRWTVSGPCVNGSDTMSITVPPPSQSITAANTSSQLFCNGRTSALLSGNTPVYSGETVAWTKVSGSGTQTFGTPAAPNTTVSGLSGTSSYTFRYTITNALTGCSSTGDHTIGYVTTPSVGAISNVSLPCDVTSASVSYTTSGGNQTSYQIISAPDAWGSTPTSPTVITSSPLVISGLNYPGVYIVRITRSSPGGASCSNASQTFSITVSRSVVGANAGTPQYLNCNVDTTFLAGNVQATGYSASWSQVSGPNSAIIENPLNSGTKVTGFIKGMYIFRWLIAGGNNCPNAQSDVKVYFSPVKPLSVSAGSSKTICYGSPVTLDANTPAQNETGTWSVTPSSGVVFSNVNNPKAVVTGLAANTAYTFKWKVNNACGADSSTAVITTNNTLGPPQAAAGSDMCLPSGTTSVTLSANNPAPASGKWTKVSGGTAAITNDTMYNTGVTGMANGTYLFEWRNSRGSCAATRDTVMITISPAPTTANAGNDMDSCGASVTFNANTISVGTGTWSQVSGPGGWSISNVNDPKAKLSALVQGRYVFRWSVANGACTGTSDDVVINISTRPTSPNAGASQKLCGTGTSLVLNANKITNGTGYWSIAGAAPNTPLITYPDSNITSVTGLITGIYRFRWSSTTGGACATLTSDVIDTVVLRADAGADQALCGSTSTTLTGTAGSTGTWSKFSSGPGTVSTTSANTALASGMTLAGSPYTFVYNIPVTYTCPATSDTVTVKVADSTSLPNAGPDQNLCNQTSFTLAGNNVSPNTGTWSKVSGPAGTITNANLYNSSVTGAGTGTFVFRWTVSNGTCSRADEVRIVNSALPTAANAGTDKTVCPPSAAMTANTAAVGNGTWEQTSGPTTAVIASINVPTTTISNLTQGTYKFVWKIANGSCPVSIDTVQVNLPNLNPTTANAGYDSLICNRTNTRFAANTPVLGTGAWTKISGSPTSTIASSGNPASALTLSTAGTYRFIWTITNGICTSKDTVVYIMYALPTVANAGIDSNICRFTPVALYGNNPTAGTGGWSRISGPTTVVFADSTKNNTTVSGLDTGTYTFRWTVRNGVCASSFDDVKIRMIPLPAPAIGGPNQYFCGPATTVSGSADSVGTGRWSQVSGPNTATIVSPNNRNTAITNLISGTYRFRYAIQNLKCVSSDTINLVRATPTPNNTCQAPDSITRTSGVITDSLCAATAQAGEPSTCGKTPCNSVWYRFKTNPANYTGSISIDFISISKAPNGIRVSLFNNGSCPSVGTQFGSCQVVTTPSVITFSSLDPNSLYYLLIDDNSPVCGSSEARFAFQINGTALPVELIRLQARLLDQNQSVVSWVTATETNNKAFDIERKVSGDAYFKKVGELAGHGTTQVPHTYSFLDDVSSIPQGIIYYRLKQNDYNGEFQYSGIVSVNKRLGPIQNAVIYPNPTTGILKLGLLSDGDNKGVVEVVDNMGRRVYSRSLSLEDGLNEKSIDLSGFDNGIYQVTFRTDAYSYSQKIMLMR